MESSLLFGYLGALLMGITLGMIGGGGSILAVPLLAGVFGLPGRMATYYSLFIVGVAAAIGLLPYARRRLVEFRVAGVFFLTSVVGVFFARRWMLPRIPDVINLGSWVGISDWVISKDRFLLVAFGILMLSAALSMLRNQSAIKDKDVQPHFLRVGLQGVFIGALTGFVGAGGGFMIIPALVNGLKVPMQRAVGTSLTIIALNSLSGFSGDWIAGIPADWGLILPFTAVALVGIGLGTWLNPRVPIALLKKGFGWFVLIVGAWMVWGRV